jgi:hypothetical protein
MANHVRTISRGTAGLERDGGDLLAARGMAKRVASRRQVVTLQVT